MQDAWTRRQALALTGSAISFEFAGCSENPSDEPRSTATRSPITEDEFEFGVEVLEQFTAEHPASVRFSFTNTGNRQFILTPSNLGPLNQHYVEKSDSSTAKIVLVGPDVQLEHPETPGAGTEPPSEPQNGCWTLNADLVRLVGQEYGELAPGKTISEDFTCYSHRENENCLPAGEYSFTESHDLQPGSIGQDGRRGPTVKFEFLISLLIDESDALSVDVEY